MVSEELVSEVSEESEFKLQNVLEVVNRENRSTVQNLQTEYVMEDVVLCKQVDVQHVNS